jgi:hypothetical protein
MDARSLRDTSLSLWDHAVSGRARARCAPQGGGLRGSQR